MVVVVDDDDVNGSTCSGGDSPRPRFWFNIQIGFSMYSILPGLTVIISPHCLKFHLEIFDFLESARNTDV